MSLYASFHQESMLSASLTKYYICIARDAFVLKNVFPIFGSEKVTSDLSFQKV